jgi:hypothetical protein
VIDQPIAAQEAEALAALGGAGKRVKVHDAQMVLKVPHTVKRMIKAEGLANDVSEATVVRWALAEYFEKRGIGTGQ